MAVSFGGAKQLVADFQAKTEEFNRKIRAANDNVIKLGNSVNKTSKAISILGPNFKFMAGIIGVAAGAIAGIVARYSQLIDQNAKLAVRLGISYSELQKFSIAAGDAGVDISSIERAMQKFNLTIGEASTGSQTAIDKLSQLGLKFNDLAAMNPASRFEMITKALNGISDPTVRAAVGTDLLGKSYEDLIPLIENSGTAYEIAAQKQSLIFTASDDQVKAVESMNDEWSQLTATVSGWGEWITVKMAPILEWLLRQFNYRLVPVIKIVGLTFSNLRNLFELVANAIAMGFSWMVNIVLSGVEKLLNGFKELKQGLAGIAVDIVEFLNVDGLANLTGVGVETIQGLKDFANGVDTATSEVKLGRLEMEKYSRTIKKIREDIDKNNNKIQKFNDIFVAGRVGDNLSDTPPEETIVTPITKTTSGGSGKIKEEISDLQKLQKARENYIQSLIENIEQQNQLNIALETYGQQVEDNIVSIESLRAVSEAGFQAGTQEFDMAVKLTEEYNRQKTAIDELIKKKEEANKKFKKFSESFIEQSVSMEQIGEEAGAKFGDFFNNIIDGSVRGQLNFRDMARSIIQDLTAMILKALFWKALGGFGIGGNKGTGILGAIGGIFGSENGNVFNAGNVIPFASGGVVGGPTFFPLNGKMGLMGEAGPEAIMPLKRGPDGKLGVAGGGGGGIQNIFNVTINPGQNQSPADARAFAEEFNRAVDQRLTYTMAKQAAKGRSNETTTRRVGL